MKKMLQNKTLDSFTLMEMIVVMAITSIVVVIALLAYSIIQRQFINYQNQSRVVNNISGFINTFENDIYKANEIIVDGNLINISNDRTKCTYAIDEHRITRQIGEKFDLLIDQIPIIEFQEYKMDNTSQIQVSFILLQDTLVYLTTFSRTSNQ